MLSGSDTDRPRNPEAIIDAVGDIDETGLLPAEIYNNEQIHQLELEQIFGQSWIFVGHESEIPVEGDYALRYIGTDPFIFVHDANGDIQVLFDSCRHRGTTVVRGEQGNTSHFRCPYHNWTYKNTGELVGVPRKNESFEDLDLCEWGLKPAPKVDTYNGLVFACLDEDGESLDEYLGDFKWYLDLHLQFTEGGMEVVGDPIRWEVDTNWKLGADNFAGDTYHTLSTHKTIVDLDLIPQEYSGAGTEREQYHVTDCDGHATGMAILEDTVTYGGYPEELFSEKYIGPERLDIMKRNFACTGTVFPNLSFINIFQSPDPENKPATGYLSMRKWQPLGPSKTQVWNWVLVPKDASEEFKERAYQTAVTIFSSAGNTEQDDFAVWDGIAETAGSTFASTESLNLNYQMGMDGMGDVADISEEWPGPGTVYDSNFEDRVMHTIHKSWHEKMSSVPGEEK